MTDVEGGLRDWLRTEPAVAAIVAQRVFVSVPPKTTLPYVTIGLVDEHDDTSTAPLDVCLVQIDAWAGNKRQARDLYNAIKQSLRDATCGLTLASGTTLKGAVIVGTVYLPDPEDQTPRYSGTAQVIVT